MTDPYKECIENLAHTNRKSQQSTDAIYEFCLKFSLDKDFDSDIFTKNRRVSEILGKFYERVLAYESDGSKFLGIGHESGCDIINEKRRFVMEVKSRYNSDNASSRRQNYRELALYARKYNLTPIYAIVNPKSNSEDKFVQFVDDDGKKTNIRWLSGEKLWKFMTGKSSKVILEKLQKIAADHDETSTNSDYYGDSDSFSVKDVEEINRSLKECTLAETR